MPSCDPANIEPIVRELYRLRPRSILDLGCGMGKFGVLAREYLEAGSGRFQPEQWEVRIVGVEGFPAYLNAIHRAAYDELIVGDFTVDPGRWAHYDVVLLVDSLEHLEREAGEDLLTHLVAYNGRVIVSCPGGDYPQGPVHGNELERHRSSWTADDYLCYPGATILHRDLCHIASIPGRG